MSWLQALPAHPIFTLPADAQSSLSTHPSLSELPRPASPDVSSLFSTSTSTPRGFGRSRSRKGAVEESIPGGRRSRMVLVRGVDLIVAVGSELRIANLSDVKAKCEERAGTSTPIGEGELLTEVEKGEYKVLATPCITFEIQQLVLNETSKLLAVVGQHSVALVVLPRKGWTASISHSLECRSLLVGRFYHALPASPSVAQVAWHPLGENSSSLLVLTSDATLREYSIGEDAEEPTQTISFSEKSAAQGGFSSLDADAAKAVSFATGDGKGDWGPLTLYCLMRNGDVFAICPFLPKRASLPSSYIHSLSCFVSAKFEYLSTAEQEQGALVALKRSSASTLASSKMSNGAVTHRQTFETRYTLQMKYVSALVRQVSSSSQKSPDDAMDVDAEETDRPVRTSAPAMARTATPMRQGPFLMQPEPVDIQHDEESFACDMTYLSYEATNGRHSASNSGEPALGVIAISYTDGKVDLCLEGDKVEARWGEMDEDEELPTLIVYETIDLGLSACLPEGHDLSQNHVQIVRDPLYADTLYLYHDLGSHCILMASWLDELVCMLETVDEDEEDQQKKLERCLRAQKGSDVLWTLKTGSVADSSTVAVVGLLVVNDVYLGYSQLMMTSSLQLVAIDLSLRVDSSLLPGATVSASSLKHTGVSSEPPAYLSLLATPFTIPAPLDRRPGQSAVPRLALKAPASSSTKVGGKAELVITADTLRFMGKTVESFRHEIRDLVAAADVVQRRLELQMKELARQLDKLNELSRLSDSLRRSTSSKDGLGGRLARVTKQQEELLARTDRILQRLMDAHDPMLSTYEKKWFEELGRLEKEVSADAGGDSSLERRAERVIAQLDHLRPGLEELKSKDEGSRADKSSSTNSLDTPGRLGQSQMANIQAKLAQESKLIAEARQKLEALTSTLASTYLS